MKKLLIVGLSIMMIFSCFALTACGNKDKETTPSDQSLQEEEQKPLYIGDRMDTKDIPTSSIGDIAMVAVESEEAGVAIANNVINVNASNAEYLYFEVEKGKSIDCDVYMDGEYEGSTTLIPGRQKIALKGDAKTIGNHNIFFIAYKDSAKKTPETVSFFKTFNYSVIEKSTDTESKSKSKSETNAPDTDTQNNKVSKNTTNSSNAKTDKNENNDSVTVVSDDGNGSVLVQKGTKTYHKKFHGKMNDKNSDWITMEDARALNLSPCKTCYGN